MNESLHKFMRVGILHFMAYPEAGSGEGDVLNSLRKIVLDDYFDAVTITWIKDPDVRRQARKLLEASHMTVCYGAHPSLLSTGLNLNHLDDAERRKAIDMMKQRIDEAYEIGAINCIFLSGHYDDSKIDPALDALVASTDELCAYAKAKGDLQVVLEVFDHKIDKKSLIGPAPLAKRYAEAVAAKHDNFGLIVDLSHIPLIGEKPHEAIPPVKDYLAGVDIGNCILKEEYKSLPSYGDKHPWFGFPGGENDVDQVVEFLKTLFDVGYLNAENPPLLSFEVKPLPNEDSDVIIANAKRTLNAAWAKLSVP